MRRRPVSWALRDYDSCCPARPLATPGPGLTSSRGIRPRLDWLGCREGFCRLRLRLGEREHRMVGWVGQFAKVAVDGPARLFLIRGQDGLALRSRGFARGRSPRRLWWSA